MDKIIRGCFTMILEVASGLLATYFINIGESNRTDCFRLVCLLLFLYFRISFVVIESSRYKFEI